MNERIKELAAQAERTVGGTFTFNGGEVSIVDLEKFAELIVRECVTAIIKDERLNDVRSASNGCIKVIKEHFGVE